MQKGILTEFFIDQNIWNKLSEETSSFKNLLILHGEKALDSVKSGLDISLDGKSSRYIHFGHECSNITVESILKQIDNEKFDLVLGVGGGKAIDTAKIIAEKSGLPIYTVPTIASTCAAVSAISVLYKDSHEFQELYFLKRPPQKTFVNLQTVFEAPRKYMWAGIGDTMAKYYEMSLKARGNSLNFSTAVGEKLSLMCKESMLNFGKEALENETHISDALKEVVGTIVVTTGMVSNIIDFKYNGALAHIICQALTLLERVEKEHLHGEVVAFGILVQLLLEENMEEHERLCIFYKGIGLPTKLSDIVVWEEYLEKKDEIVAVILTDAEKTGVPLSLTKLALENALERNI